MCCVKKIIISLKINDPAVTRVGNVTHLHVLRKPLSGPPRAKHQETSDTRFSSSTEQGLGRWLNQYRACYKHKEEPDACISVTQVLGGVGTGRQRQF